MKLSELLQNVKVLNEVDCEIEIENIAFSTSQDMRNGAFICLKGGKFDGHDFMSEAQEKGAKVFVVEKLDKNFSGMQVLVKDTREALSIISKNFYFSGGLSMPKMIGITGTNGKTTTANLVSHILKSSGKKVGLIGTEGIVWADEKIVTHMTTPDPIELFKNLALMAQSGVEYVVMEVSAHAIALKKIAALDFLVVACTNITEDHLDFFKNLKAYQNTKLNFLDKFGNIKIVNLDDECGQKFAKSHAMSFTYSKKGYADMVAENFNSQFNEFSISIGKFKERVKSYLLGEFNVENILCASLITYKLGISLKDIAASLQTFKPVAGRLNLFAKQLPDGQNSKEYPTYEQEKVSVLTDKQLSNEIYAVIDFAHTPDAFIKIFETLRGCFKGKLICVFGCGGDREKEKRAPMGEIASRCCDYVIITSDNPRSENVLTICCDIASGIKNKKFEILIDRKAAIYKALSMAGAGDCIAILGKGAEDYIEINKIKYAYSDKETILELGFMEN